MIEIAVVEDHHRAEFPQLEAEMRAASRVSGYRPHSRRDDRI
jgi:hypothetical protein